MDESGTTYTVDLPTESGIEHHRGDNGLTAPDRVLLRLDKRERELVLRYGYPFDDLEQQLERAAENYGVVTISIDPFYAEQLTADFVYSAKHLTDQELLEELDALITKIENRIRFHGV